MPLLSLTEHGSPPRREIALSCVGGPRQDHIQSLLFKAVCSCLSTRPFQTECADSHLTYFRRTKKTAWRRHTLSGTQTSLKDTSGKIYGSSCVLRLPISSPLPQSNTTWGGWVVVVSALAASLRRGPRSRKGKPEALEKGSQITNNNTHTPSRL